MLFTAFDESDANTDSKDPPVSTPPPLTNSEYHSVLGQSGLEVTVKALTVSTLNKKQGILYQEESWDLQRKRLYRFDLGSCLMVPFLKKEFLAPRRLIDTTGKCTDHLVLLSIWLSECGKYYFIVLNATTKEVKRYRAKCYVLDYETENEELPPNWDELSDALDHFILHGKKDEHGEAEVQAKHASWVLEDQTSANRRNGPRIPNDILDYGDNHGFMVFNEVVAHGLCKDWGSLGCYYTTIHMGVEILLQLMWFVAVDGYSSASHRFIYAGVALPTSATTYAEKQGCMVFDLHDNTLRIVNRKLLTVIEGNVYNAIDCYVITVSYMYIDVHIAVFDCIE